jgi:hypothetical protein
LQAAGHTRLAKDLQRLSFEAPVDWHIRQGAQKRPHATPALHRPPEERRALWRQGDPQGNRVPDA